MSTESPKKLNPEELMMLRELRTQVELVSLQFENAMLKMILKYEVGEDVRVDWQTGELVKAETNG